MSAMMGERQPLAGLQIKPHKPIKNPAKADTKAGLN